MSLETNLGLESSQESPKDFFERSKTKGAEYISLVRSFANMPANVEEYPFLNTYAQAGKAYFDKQKEKFGEQSLNAVGLLAQAWKPLPEDVHEQCTLEEMSPWLFIVKVTIISQ